MATLNGGDFMKQEALKILKISQWLFLFLTVLMTHGVMASDFVDAYIDNVREGSTLLRTQTYKKIYDYSGITDIRLFDEINSRVLNSYKKEKPSRDELEELGWALKALAASGNIKYRNTLKKVAADAPKGRTKKHARDALESLPNYARWNPVITSEKFEQVGRKPSVALWMRFIDSDHNDLALTGVNKASEFKVYEPALTELVEAELRDRLRVKTKDKVDLELQGRMIRYLAEHPEFGKYTSLFSIIAEESPNKKVRKWALKSLG